MPIQLGFGELEIQLCSIFCKEIPTRATVHCPFGIQFRENLVDGSKHTLELKLYGRNGL
jgi:hypothetical protein